MAALAAPNTRDKDPTSMLSHHISGPVARKRIIPLLEARGILLSEANLTDDQVDFMWENTPSKGRKSLRDGAKVYSHLAQGHILEDKWALALLQLKVSSSKECPLLESHCLRGRNAVAEWCSKRWISTSSLSTSIEGVEGPEENEDSTDLWVLKDAESNGAGGIWILSNHNWEKLCATECDPLHESHRYVAQKYVNRLALWNGRKFHIRTYVVVSADLGVYIHKKAFLHIANKMFVRQGGSESDDEVHITNCCANSDNLNSFAGEIVIDDLTSKSPYPGTGNENTKWKFIGDATASLATTTHGAPTDNNTPSSSSGGVSENGEISFSTGFMDMCQILKSIIDAAAPFLEAQTSQCNFEYMGVDFMIDENGRAYLLECNCPPSQDTATGLKHAEDLHNTVMSDVLGAFVLPHFCFNGGGSSDHDAMFPPVPPEKVGLNDDPKLDEVISKKEVIDNHGDAVLESRYSHMGEWVEARKPSLIPFSAASKTVGNHMRWKMYESKCLREVNQAQTLQQQDTASAMGE